MDKKEDNKEGVIPEKKQETKTPPGRFQRGPHPPSPSGKEVNLALRHLPKEGLVAQAPRGMVYVDLDDAWILSIRKLLAKYGYVVAPLFYPIHPGNPRFNREGFLRILSGNPFLFVGHRRS